MKPCNCRAAEICEVKDKSSCELRTRNKIAKTYETKADVFKHFKWKEEVEKKKKSIRRWILIKFWKGLSKM